MGGSIGVVGFGIGLVEGLSCKSEWIFSLRHRQNCGKFVRDRSLFDGDVCRV